VLVAFFICLAIAGCGGQDRTGQVIFDDSSDPVEPHKIKVHQVKITSESEDELGVEIVYTYNHEVPAEQIKLFIMPDHGYWSTRDIMISEGKNVGRTSIGLSKSNMKKDNVTSSDTTKLRIHFEHYLPKKYVGSVWREDVKFDKHWELK
jgi:hypothetical protein